jgi:hypothetical protein
MTTVPIDMPTPTMTTLLSAQVPRAAVKASRMVANKSIVVTPRLTRSTAPKNITETPPAGVNNKGGKRYAKKGQKRNL